MTQLTLHLLGAPRVEVDQAPIDLSRRKVMAILVYVALSPKPIERELLATMLWPDSEPKSARAALRRELHTLNNAIGSGWLETTRSTVALPATDTLEIDVTAFRAAIVAAQHGEERSAARAKNESDHVAIAGETATALMNAINLYQGDFLAGFTLSDSPAFDDWQFFEAEGLRRDYAAALNRLAEIMRSHGQYEEAIDYTRRHLLLDTLDESIHRTLMVCYALAGQQAAAVRQYDECVRILDEELGVPPDEETVALYEQIRKRQFPIPETMPKRRQQDMLSESQSHLSDSPPSSPRGLSQSPGLSHNLPAQSTSFVGRYEELEAITQILREEAECRLLTLVGPGGIGKTRLALQVAQELIDDDSVAANAHYRDGIYFVPLETVDDREQMVAVLANALGFIFHGSGQPQNQLLNFLQTKQLLLILDNIEHLSDQADFLATLLQSVPELTILATSREALALQEEWLFAVMGFALPQMDAELDATVKPDHTKTFEQTKANSAVQLFIQRARRADSTLALMDEELSDETLAQIARICQLVDGLPLGLELAATWVRTLNLQEIGDEIAADLDFLTTTKRGVPERHSSMRAVLEQTWRLLTRTEQDLFCKLAFFANGFTRQAATRVADASMLILAALVRKSIINHGRDGRYRMHGLLRQFAATRLQADPAWHSTIAEKHSRYFGLLLQTWEGELSGTGNKLANNVYSPDLLTVISNDLDNIRQGWRWAVANSNGIEQSPLVNTYVDSLFHFYDTRSRFQEGWTEFQAAVHTLANTAYPTDNSSATERLQLIQGRLFARLGWFAFQIGQPVEAKTALHQSLELLRPLEDQREIIFALNYLGAIQRHSADYEAAVQTLEESRQRCRESDDRFGLTVALNILGQVAYEQHAYTEAQHALEESLAIKNAIGDRRGTTYSLLYLGLIAQAQGDPAKAIRLFQESRLISEEYGDRRGIAIALSNWADVEAALGQMPKARELYEQSLMLYTEIHNLPSIVALQVKLGDLAYELHDQDVAQHHYETALHNSDALHLPLGEREKLVGHVQKRLFVEHS